MKRWRNTKRRSKKTKRRGTTLKGQRKKKRDGETGRKGKVTAGGTGELMGGVGRGKERLNEGRGGGGPTAAAAVVVYRRMAKYFASGPSLITIS